MTGLIRLPPIEYIGTVGATSANSLGVHASTVKGDVVVCLVGHAGTTGGCLCNSPAINLATAEGTSIEYGAAWDIAEDNSYVFTFTTAARHRSRTLTFRNCRVGVRGSATPTFATSGTAANHPAVTVPPGIQARSRILLGMYALSDPGTPIPPAPFIDLGGGNQTIKIYLSNKGVEVFTGDTVTLINSVSHGKYSLVVE